MRDLVDAQQHGARQRIESQVVEKIAEVNILHVAKRREQRKPMQKIDKKAEVVELRESLAQITS